MGYWKAKRPLINERGQAAIFVALMFNVLFVFFAMAINVALVVHDKINLQNSVDLAAYYAAMKQAELMNVIAHENYMIRQSYKLLAWRYRTLGTMGLYRSSVHPVWSGEMSDSPFQPAVKPSLCITYKPTWKEVPEGENLCNEENLRIPPLPQVQVVAGFLGINQGIANLSNLLRAQFDQQCQKHGAYNWWFAMSILHAFRVDQRNRKQVIFALAKNLSSSGDGDFKDLDGNSVLAGAQETFKKNLTFTNAESFKSKGSFKIMNSLAGVDPKQWLVEIKIIPTIIYTDVDNTPGCNASPTSIQNLPQRPGAQALLNQPFPQGLDAGGLMQWRQDSFLTDSDYQYSIGVERNPWYMPYVGVQAETNPRQVFFPLGSGVQMKARAFAKPFGGRTGPWYQSKWEKGAPASEGDLTDSLVAPRVAAGGLMNSPDDPRRLPNYARYPGDKLGMSSKLSLNSIAGLGGMNPSFDFYKNVKQDIVQGNNNDILAAEGDIRNFEIAALAPDLFDITYYSIEPDFAKNYLPRLTANASSLGIASDVVIRPDLGFNQASPAFTVQDQMALAKNSNLQKNEAYYFVRDRAHLLTSWLPGPAGFNYDVTQALDHFGKCGLTDDGLKYPNPGSCIASGGRTGYSVKLISRDALLSSQHKIGGPSAAANSIINPPSESDGW